MRRRAAAPELSGRDESHRPRRPIKPLRFILYHELTEVSPASARYGSWCGHAVDVTGERNKDRRVENVLVLGPHVKISPCTRPYTWSGRTPPQPKISTAPASTATMRLDTLGCGSRPSFFAENRYNGITVSREASGSPEHHPAGWCITRLEFETLGGHP